MPRARRAQSPADFYHVTMRGVGRQLIFEDDDDRREFLRLLVECMPQGGEVHAWCLMDNHVHLLIHLPLGELSRAMRKLGTSYAGMFNRRHGHVGHLFQGRFGSEAIMDDAQLLATVRYIHRNPVVAGMASIDGYAWSSYGEYLSAPAMTTTGFVMSVFGGVGAFREFHESAEDDSRMAREHAPVIRIASDAEVRGEMEAILGEGAAEKLRSAPKERRDDALRLLLRRGASVRQLERLTGIGRGIIQRVGTADSGTAEA